MAQRTLSTVLCTASVLVAAGGASALDAVNLQPLPLMVSALAQSDEGDSEEGLDEEAVDEEAVADDEAIAEADPEEAIAEDEPAEEATESATAEEPASEEAVVADEEAPSAPEDPEVAEEAVPAEPPAPPAPPEPPKPPQAPPPVQQAPQPITPTERSAGWADPDREDKTIYKVVVNHEEQYSIWQANRENPLGWSDVGKTGPKQECLDYIKEVWTDMRPLALRKKMEEMERARQAESN